MKDKEKQFKERIDCGVAYCDDTAVNEVKQDFKEREEEHKQIEEIQKLIDKYAEGYLFFDDSKTFAELLYDNNVRIVPKYSVILTRKEYEDMI